MSSYFILNTLLSASIICAISSSFSPLHYLGSAHQVIILRVLQSCASSLSRSTPFSFISLHITSLHVTVGLSISSLIFSLTFATPALDLISSILIFSILFIPIIHLNILISVLSTKSFSQSSLFPSSTSTFSFLFFLPSPSLNPLYSHHPSQHSHLCSFYQVLLSILFIPIIHLNILISVLSTKSFSQSSLFPSSISTFSSLFFLPSPSLNPLYSHHPSQHSHLCSF